MIVLLGTSHISEESRKAVEQAIEHVDIVAIELDVNRAHALLSGERATFSEMRQALGLRTAIVASLLGGLQQRIAKSLDVVPGLEMKEALEAAQRHSKMVALIDRDVRVTLKRLSSNIGWPEWKQFLKDLFRRQKMSINPSDDLVAILIAEMQRSYPRVYKVMVAERDVYMARQLVAIEQEHPGKTILAVIGKGHVPGLRAQINYINAQTEVVLWSSPAKSGPRSSSSASSRASSSASITSSL